MSPTDETLKKNWQPLRELALKTPYTMEYLSLMARRKQLKVKKTGRLWYSTLENVREFEEEMKKRKEQRKERMRNSYYKKPENQSARKNISQKNILDQIQTELEDVLEEIREKERRLKEEYRSGMPIGNVSIEFHTNPEAPSEGIASSIENKEKYIQKEKQETEELSEKLIMDLGRLLNTANQIQDDVMDSRTVPETAPRDQEGGEEYKIPINRRQATLKDIQVYHGHHETTKRMAIGEPEMATTDRIEENERKFDEDKLEGGEDFTNHTPFLSLNYGSSRYDSSRMEQQEEIERHFRREHYADQIEKENPLLKIITFFIIGILACLSLIFILFLLFY